MDAEQMVKLQRIDTALDQLAHRVKHLPERVARDAARARRTAWEKRAASLAEQAATYEAQIASAEAAGAALTEQRTRLEKQLRTVIAPREAEALMHEIDNINVRRSELDDGELEALAALGDLEAERMEHAAVEPEVDAAAADAEAVFAAADAAAAAEASQLREQRAALAAAIDAADLHTYEALRKQFDGIAIAQLAGHTCGGCHLDLTAAEMDTVRAVPAGDIPECPHCGRLLAR